MKQVITDIKEQVRNKDRVNIFINGNYEFSASKYSVKKNNLKVGKEIKKEDVVKVTFIDDVEKAKGYIVDYHLNKTYAIIRRKLKEKEYSEEVITEVVSFLERYNLINDAQYAKNKTKDLQKIKKNSKRAIAFKLKRDGVSEEEIEEALLNIDEDLEYENAKKIVEKKEKEYKKKSGNIYEYKNRIYKLLASKAYDSSIINKIMKEMEERWEENE